MMHTTLSLKPSASLKPASSAEVKRKLFEEYELADHEVAAAKAIFEAALAKRSNVVKAIHDAYGKGPFNYRGGVTIVIRPNKTTGVTTYFFRERSKKELEDIDE